MSELTPFVYMPIVPPQYHHHPLHYYHHPAIHYQQYVYERYLLQSYQEEIYHVNQLLGSLALQETENQNVRSGRRNNNNNKNARRRNNKNKNAMISIWTSPGNDLLKLNTDGCSKGNPGPSSIGGLIRDGKGRWICGYIGKMKGRSYTGLEAEVWSIYRGLCLIKEKNLSKVMIETDCKTILTMISGRVLEKDNPLRSVMEAIEKMMIEHECTIIHTRRDGNHCADQLANLGGKQPEEYTVLEEPPELLKPYLLRDVENIS